MDKDRQALREHYQTLDDETFLEIAVSSSLTNNASAVVAEEIKRRNLAETHVASAKKHVEDVGAWREENKPRIKVRDVPKTLLKLTLGMVIPWLFWK